MLSAVVSSPTSSPPWRTHPKSHEPLMWDGGIVGHARNLGPSGCSPQNRSGGLTNRPADSVRSKHPLEMAQGFLHCARWLALEPQHLDTRHLRLGSWDGLGAGFQYFHALAAIVHHRSDRRT